MPVERFSRSEFEAALPVHKETGEPLWQPLGLVSGEYTYRVPINGGRVAIEVRSSIRYSGVAADTGKDSIRAWLIDVQTGKPVGSKVSKWTTRVPGWQERLTDVLRTLYQWRMRAGDCPQCGEPKGIFKVKKESKNKGRPFAKCTACNNGFIWLDETPKTNPYFSNSSGANESNQIKTSNEGSKDRDSLVPLGGEGTTSKTDTTSVKTETGIGSPEAPDTSDPVPSPSNVLPLGDSDSQAIDDLPEEHYDEGEPVERDRPIARMNKFQQAVIDAGARGPIVVEACAGSGKTRTIENLVASMIESGIDPAKIGVFTFSNSAAAEARHRIALTLWPNISEKALAFITEPHEHRGDFPDSWLDEEPAQRMLVDWTCTIHALSFRLLKELTGKKLKVLADGQDRWDADGLIKDSLKEFDWEESLDSVKSYIGWAIRELVVPAKAADFYKRVLAGTDVSWRSEHLAEIFRRYYDFCKSRGLIDFEMMQARIRWMMVNDPVFLEKAQQKFDYILVDEAQDSSLEQCEILWKLAEKSGNIVFCGDVDQCVVEGTLISTEDGQVPVGNIKVGDTVISGHGKGTTQSQMVTGVHRNSFHGTVVTVHTKGGYTITTTPEHVFFARHTAAQPGEFYVYLMYRKGLGFRIGRTNGAYNHAHTYTGYKARLGQEHADKVWVIKECEDEGEAHWWEHYFSIKYQIPTFVFEARGKLFDQSGVERMFHSFDTASAARHLLSDLHMKIGRPHHEVKFYNSESKIRRCVHITLCAGSSPYGYHMVSVSGSEPDDLKKVNDVGIPAKLLSDMGKSGRGWRFTTHYKDLGDAYALLEKAREIWPDIKIAEKARLANVTLDFVPASHLLKGMTIFVERNGEIVTDEVESTERDLYTGDVYDLDVANTHNFISNSVVTHNSMYAFRGAHPSVLREDFEATWPDVQRFNLPINYRSTKAIIEAASRLVGHNYDGPDDPYLKPFDSRPDAKEGEPLSFVYEPEFGDLAKEVANLVAENPQDWFILSRTRAECAAIHLELIRQGVPAVNKSGGILFGAPHVRKVLAYARLACDYQNARDDLEILSEIANVASVEFKAPFTRRRHRDGCHNDKGWIDCGCPVIAEGDVDYSHTRFYGQAAIKYAGGWDGVLHQRYETNRGGYPTTRAKGAEDLVRFVQRIEKLKDDAGACLNMIISDCVLPWLAVEYDVDGDDPAENGKGEDLALLLSMAKQGQTMSEYLDEVENLTSENEKGQEGHAVTLGTIHWSKGRESKAIVVNLTRCPIVPPAQKPGKLPMGKPPTIEEERRLAYVAVTRAKERCVVVAAGEWNGQGVEESPFVSEIGIRGCWTEEDDMSDSVPGPDILTMNTIRQFVNDNPDHPVAVAWAEMLADDCYEVGEYAEAAEEAQFEAGLEMDEFMESLEAG